MKNKFIYIILSLFIGVSVYRLYDLTYTYKDKYTKEFNDLNNKIITINNSPRGRILDTNGKVLVDNKGVNTLIYNKLDNSTKDEIKLSKSLSKILDIDASNTSEYKLKTYYLVTHNNGDNLIKNKEKKLYKERKLSSKDIEKLKYDRIDDNILDNIDKKEALIYSKLSNGYSYEDKAIKYDLTDKEVSLINDLHNPNLRINITYKRVYPYGNTFKNILGTIGKIPKEKRDYYLNKGIALDSIVGTSFLEEKYDDILRGSNSIYTLKNNRLKLIKKGETGKDLTLSIDIDKENMINNILKEEIIKAKNAKNSDYFNHSYIILGKPDTGEILAMSGMRISDNGFQDITSNIINSSYTVGSVVKGATIGVGYKYNLIKPNEYVNDSCIKIKNVPKKCSWKRLGRINDIRALAMSSNYFQFLIATRLSNPGYKWNSKLNANAEHFKAYRDMLSSYGLGSMTGIDLNGEVPGLKGKKVSDDLLLNLSIGQYDSYTPIELYQYINTIANNGTRLAPSLKKGRIKNMGKVDLSDEYLARIREGLKAVTTSGTGRNYTNHKMTSAGKTGTSETFVDTNNDGKMDTKTISTAFIMYMPYENPKYSLVIISPNIGKVTGTHNYKYNINLNISKKITDNLS